MGLPNSPPGTQCGYIPTPSAPSYGTYQGGYAPVGGTNVGYAQIAPYQQGLTPQQIQAGFQRLSQGMGNAQQNFNALGTQARCVHNRMGQMGQMFAQNAQNAGNSAYNPAIGAYQQALNQNSQNIGAQLASQRGAAADPGLAARNVGQAGAVAAQNAAGQMSSQVAQFKEANQGMESNAYQAQGQLTNQAYGLQGQAAGIYGQIANAYAQAGLANQGQILNAIAAQNAANVAMQSNVNSSNVAMQSNINMANVAMQSNMNEVMAQQMMNNNNLATQVYGMGLGYNANVYGSQMGYNSARDQNYQSNGLLGLPIPILSDEREKKDVKDAGNKIDRFLRALGSHEYRYKDPKKPGAAKGKHVSPMAQELEKTELGKSMVVKAKDGTKMVDYGRGLGTILAAQARLNQRLDTIEMKKEGVRRLAKGGIVKDVPKYAFGGRIPESKRKRMAEGGGVDPDTGDDAPLAAMGGGGNAMNQQPFSLGADFNSMMKTPNLMPGEQAGMPTNSSNSIQGPASILGKMLQGGSVGGVGAGGAGGGMKGHLQGAIAGAGASLAAGNGALGGALLGALGLAHGGMARPIAQVPRVHGMGVPMARAPMIHRVAQGGYAGGGNIMPRGRVQGMGPQLMGNAPPMPNHGFTVGGVNPMMRSGPRQPIRLAQGGNIVPDTSNPNFWNAQHNGQAPGVGMQANVSNQPPSMGQGAQGAMGAMGTGQPPMGQVMQGQGPAMQNMALAGSPNQQIAMPSTGLPMGNAQTRGGAPMPSPYQGQANQVAMQGNINGHARGGMIHGRYR